MVAEVALGGDFVAGFFFFFLDLDFGVDTIWSPSLSDSAASSKLSWQKPESMQDAVADGKEH